MNLITNEGQLSQLSKISSEFCLKKVFSFVNCKTTLNVVKYSRELQNKLGINLQNYITESNYVYVERKIRILNPENPYEPSFRCLSLQITGAMSGIFLLSFLIYITLLITLFDEKENFDKNYIDIIKAINMSLFILIFAIICSFFVLNFFIFKNYGTDTKLKKNIKMTILIFIILIHFIYKGLIIWKIVLSYNIEKVILEWYMILDFLFIAFNFIYIIYMIIITILYYLSSGKFYIYKTDFYLTAFKDIKVIYFLLPNFNKLNRQEKLKYIYRNIKNIVLFIPQEELNLIYLINNFRQKNNVNKLEITNRRRIPSFIINPPSVIILSPYKNIFQFKNTYLLRYQIGEFENKLKNNNEEITNILLKENLNKIMAVRQSNFQLIWIFQSSNPIDFELLWNPKKQDLYTYDRYSNFNYNFEDETHTI